MNPQRSFLAFGLLLALGALAAAQEPLPFVWSEHDVYDESGNLVLPGGGMVDLETGLVWSMSVSRITLSDYTWDYAMQYVPSQFAESEWSFGYTDWRLPTVDELYDAGMRGLRIAFEQEWGTLAPSRMIYWTSTAITNPPKYAYAVELYDPADPVIYVCGRKSALGVILCRSVAAPPPPPSKPPKPPKPPKK